MDLNKVEKSLLAFLETCEVDQGGLILGSRMNTEEHAIANKWNDSGFIQFGRIASADIKRDTYTPTTHWVLLSEEAWEKAHIVRKERALRKRNSVKVDRIGLSLTEVESV